MMDAYTSFALVYDIFMDETPYEEWKNQIVSKLKEDGICDGLILDLGCGTGCMTELLYEEGYDMIGVDLSMEMLQIAREKYYEKHTEPEDKDILYLCQDMRSFELYGTVRAVVSVCDCINYLLEDEEVIQTFRLVNNYLDPKGLFIFDFNTVHKYRDIIGERTIAENREDCSFIWENYYDEEKKYNEYQLTIFSRVDEYYEKFEEEHIQRGYELLEMISFLEKAGMEFVRAYDTDNMQEVSSNSQRVTVIAREKYTEGKYYQNE